MMPKSENAVIHGTGAAVVGAVARPFAREGTRAPLTDCHLASVHNKVAKDILFVGGIAGVSRVDTRDEPAVDAQV
jgi:hypothetical protein